MSCLMRSPRVSTFLARCNWFFRRKLLSIDMAYFPSRNSPRPNSLPQGSKGAKRKNHLKNNVPRRQDEVGSLWDKFVTCPNRAGERISLQGPASQERKRLE